MRLIRLRSSRVLLLCLLVTAPVLGQSTRPVVNAGESQGDQAIENQSLRISDSSSKPAALRSEGAASATSNASDLMRIVLALAVVIGVILLLRAGVRRMSAMSGGIRPGKLVTVLSRSMISPRQQILVLQVGKRLLVVGDSGGTMNQLCELTDPDEIAALIGQTRQSHDVGGDRKAISFGNLFRRANQPFGNTEGVDDSGEISAAALDDEAAKNDPPPEPASVEEVGGLLDKIRVLQQQFKLKSELSASPSGSPAQADAVREVGSPP